MGTPDPVYRPRRSAGSRCFEARGLRQHLLEWGAPAQATEGRPPLVLLHGWMDVAASFQFLVDALAALEGEARWVLAPDWRGFGNSDASHDGGYWFPDYLADLEALLDGVVAPAWPGPIDLVGHSMGGNVAMLYAGVRPSGIRRLVNLEGFGMPATSPEDAPRHYARWLDSWRQAPSLAGYASLDKVAARLLRNDPLLQPGHAAWLAAHWARRTDVAEGTPGAWQLRADAGHKRPNPVLYRAEEALACWHAITAPVLVVEGDRSAVPAQWGGRYSLDEFHRRLAVVARVERCVLSPAGHMLHHDQPEALASQIKTFLDAA